MDKKAKELINNKGGILRSGELTPRAQPRKGAPLITLTDEQLNILKQLSVGDLMRLDRRLSSHIETTILRLTQNAIKQHIINESIASGLITAILHPRIVKRLNRGTTHPLRGLNNLQINLLCAMYSAKRLKKNVFTCKELLIFTPTYYGHAKLTMDFKLFVQCGYIEILTAEQLYNRTGKIHIKKVGRPPSFYGITRQGSDLIKIYFEEFNKLYKQFSGQFLADDLVYFNEI